MSSACACLQMHLNRQDVRRATQGSTIQGNTGEKGAKLAKHVKLIPKTSGVYVYVHN